MTRWCFVDNSALRYHPGTPEQAPLGGSQSALCWLTRELALQNHSVTLVNQAPEPGIHHGVACYHWDSLPPDFWHNKAFDLVVSLNSYTPLLELPLPPTTRTIFWNQHNHLDPALQDFNAHRHHIDAVALVSHWQRDQCLANLDWPAPQCWVLRNACTPLLQNPAQNEAELLSLKSPVPLLAYTSTPGRGLSVLLALFPALKQVFPRLQLRVYSSLQVYQLPESYETVYQPLYAEAQKLDGVSWLGSVSQSQLAEELPQAHCLAYPNIFLETSCIAALESLAAGCRVVTSAYGALPETTAGWARLVPYGPVPAFGFAFFEALCAELLRWQQTPWAMASERLAQQAWMAQTQQWHQRVADWEALAHHLLHPAKKNA